MGLFRDFTKAVATIIPFNKGIAISKDQQSGIKVDVDTPEFPWFDMEGPVYVRSVGANSPSYNVYQGSLREFQFGVNDQVEHTFHIPHDYVMGSDLYIHVHWSHNSASTPSGLVTWGLEVSYAKGHDQAPFSTPITFGVAQSANPVQYQHMIAEVQLSSSTPTALQLDSALIEPDGLIMVRTYLLSNTMSPATEPFAHFVDIHYQSTNIGTKNKVPDFWT